MKNLLGQIVNYCFPPDSYEGSKITDVRWFRKFTSIAPYLVIAIALFILIWGFISPNPTRFFIKPQFLVFLGIAFLILVISVVVKAIRKRHRNPAVFLLLATFIAIQGLIALIFFSAVTTIIKEAEVHLESKKQEISQEVQHQILTHKSNLSNHTIRLENTVKANQEKVADAFSELDSRMSTRFERFRKRDKENTEAVWKIHLENREKNKVFNTAFWKSGEETLKKSIRWKREWCRTHPLSQMCNNLPPDEEEAPAQTVEVKNDENTTYIDLPLNFKYEIRE